MIRLNQYPGLAADGSAPAEGPHWPRNYIEDQET